ncbi:MAG: hypothetical protein AB8B96_18365 [Lysobacterales bacterium]
MKPTQYRHNIVVALTLASIVACSDSPTADSATPADDPLQLLSIDTDQITVSGISSGGYMASQLHVAHSSTFSGAAIIAAGPWWCAKGNISRALDLCIKGGSFDSAETRAHLDSLASAGDIDPAANLSADPVWLFHGRNDVTVASTVVEAAAQFYRNVGNPQKVVSVTDVPAAHAIATVDQGSPCTEFSPPYINACNYDMAGELLQHLTQRRATPPTAPGGQIVAIDVPDARAANLLSTASAYVPEQCLSGTACGIHVALHGCQQSTEVIGDAFVLTAGYNRWADALDLVVLYPQVASSSLAPMNPLGCWDWWGYTGDDYVTKSAPQIAAIKNMLDTLSGVQQ